MAATDGSIITAAIINFVVLLLGFSLFSFFRKSKNQLVRNYFDPKRTLGAPAVPKPPHPLPSTFFGWIKPTYKYPEADIIRQCGLDTAIYLRIHSYGIKFFIFASFWALVVILPTNITGNATAALNAAGGKFSGFDRLSLSNVQAGNARLWVHVVSVYVLTAAALYYMWKYCQESVLLRIQYLGNMKPCGSTHSVLVTDIPAVDDKDYINGKLLGSQQGKAGGASTPQHANGTSSTTPATSMSGGYSDVEKGSSPYRGSDAAVVMVNHASPHKPATLRKRRSIAHDTYDAHDHSLDPKVIAREDLAHGMSPHDMVSNEFELVYPHGGVRAVNMVYDQSKLEGLVKEYDQVKQQLDDYVDAVKYKASKGEPLPEAKTTLYLPKYGEWGRERYGKGLRKKVPAVPFWTARLAELERQITEEQGKARQKVWPSAFVTFKTRLQQSISATGLHQHDEGSWNVRNAPAPEEVVWGNLRMTSTQRAHASALMWVLFWLMALFYTIPVSAVQGLIDVPKLAKIPGLDVFLNNTVVKKLVEAIIPGLVLKLFLIILPVILAFMVRKSGAVSLAQIDFGVVPRFFIFQVIMVFFGSVIAGSFFSQATELINNPGSIVTVLGSSIPQSATFFITYIWILIGLHSLKFSKIIGVIILLIKAKMTSSPKARARLYQEQYTTFGASVTKQTFILFLGVVFSCINPIICPSALAYFMVHRVMERYNHIYVFRRRYESAGKMWSKVLHQVMTALYIFQLCMIGLLGLKKFPYTALIAPVLIPTIAFHLMVMKLFVRPWSILSLHDAAELDFKDQEEFVTHGAEQLLEDPHSTYLPPGFKVRPGDASLLLAEGQAVSNMVEADVAQRQAGAQHKGHKKCGCF